MTREYAPRYLTPDQVKALAAQSLPQAELIAAERWQQYLQAVAALEALEVRAGVRPEEVDRADGVIAGVRKAARDPGQPGDWRDMPRAKHAPAGDVLLANSEPAAC